MLNAILFAAVYLKKKKKKNYKKNKQCARINQTFAKTQVFLAIISGTDIEIIMENIESSWNILMVINFEILQSNSFINKFSTYIL